MMFSFFAFNINAAMLENVPKQLVQPNNIVINAFYSGDEFHHWSKKDDAGVGVGGGVYFYRMNTADLTVTKKMALMK